MPNPDAWAQHYRMGSLPWDLGRPHPELERRLRLDAGLGLEEPGRALVPGCGRGHDAVALARAGWRVTAVDFVAELEHTVSPRLDPLGGRFIVGDALELEDEEGFDMVLDHTFFCALDPVDRPRFGSMASRLVSLAGILSSLMFPIGKEPGTGPPFAMSAEDLQAALGESFELTEATSAIATARASYEEAWASFRRR